ncbi:MAG TPA: CPXCG motif-containing cysteine-rich protein [Gemmatimonadales bacterium]|nr:CPXCG motif-containing cysteine-rich protein [Gemmatimonadales bacterium]
MHLPTDDDARDDDANAFEDGGQTGAPALETQADVTCPFCRETMTIALDAGGGRAQEYVEDCQVCCRPWRVRLWYDATGAVEVDVLPLE